eukprot:5503373-Pyramimonas_sp.AAC.1
MAWGGPRGVDDWVVRLKAQDTALTSLHIFKSRRFGKEVGEELYASGHDLDEAAVQAVSDMLCANSSLRTLCIGSQDFGDLAVDEGAFEAVDAQLSCTVHLQLTVVPREGLICELSFVWA